MALTTLVLLAALVTSASGKASLSSPLLPYRHTGLSDDLQDDYDLLVEQPDYEFAQTSKCSTNSQGSGCASHASADLELDALATDILNVRRIPTGAMLLSVVCLLGLLFVYERVSPRDSSCPQTPVPTGSTDAYCKVGRSIHGVIAEGAAANEEDSDDETFAAGLRATAVARLQKSAEVDAAAYGEDDDKEEQEEDVWGCSSLHLAAAQGDVDEVEALLKGPHAEDIDAREAWGATPLHFAVRQGFLKVCSLLLEHGADVEATNESGETALLVAAKEGNVAMCQRLLAHGASVDGISEDELPALLDVFQLAYGADQLPAVLNKLFMQRLVAQCED